MWQIFSSIYSILPESKSYFESAGYTKSGAGYMSNGIFLLGVLGLQIISEILHRCLPSSIVECESHSPKKSNGVSHSGHHHDHHSRPHSLHRHDSHHSDVDPTETSPLLRPQLLRPLTDAPRRPSLGVLFRKKCVNGRCYGYTDAPPCNMQCASHFNDDSEEEEVKPADVPDLEAGTQFGGHNHSHGHGHGHSHPVSQTRASSLRTKPSGQHKAPGHHHVAKNAYLSIGLQTSIAVALHKMPEGFITYATNHANPTLGSSVFLAIAIHNLCEGFVMSLPLFLALQSRWKAILTASLLGGLSQPLGALAAMLCLTPGKSQSGTVYGVLFALTAGIMSSVGVQLYGQAVSIHHSNRLCLFFGFLGMGILGLSYAMMGEEGHT